MGQFPDKFMQRAQLVRLMKTALALLEQADSKATRAMAQALIDQLSKSCRNCKGSAPGTPSAGGAVRMSWE